MKKLNFWFLASLLSGALLITSCSDKNDSDPTPAPPAPKLTPAPQSTIADGTKVNPSNMTMSALSGFVYDSIGTPLRNVEVTSGSNSCLTGPDGGFILDEVNVVNGRSIVKFSCAGYFDVVRSLPTVDGDVWEVTLSESSSYNNQRVAEVYDELYTEDISVTTAQGMTVDLQADGFKFADSDEPLSGYDRVSAQIFYLSPDDKDFATVMPGGDLAAEREVDGQVQQLQLVSYGMVCVTLNSYGERVQLADGKPATLTFPVPDKFNGSEIPAEIPLWSFDENKGLWVYEGVATYDSDKNVYVGQVKHFSWVNLDYPEKRASLIVNVKDEAGNVIPNQAVDIDGQSTYFTNVNGVVQCYVPINTDFYVTVRSSDYCNYSPEVKVNVDKILTAGEQKTVNIVLPTTIHISGKVVNSGKGNKLGSLWIEYVADGATKTTKAVHTDVDGQFIINAPFDYTSNDAKLILLTSDGNEHKFDIKLDGKDHAYTLNVKTDVSTGGVITFTPTNGAAKDFVISPVFVSDIEGVGLIDNGLYLNVNFGDLRVSIDNYSINKTAYDNANVSLYTADDNYYRVQNNAAYMTVTKNEYNNLTFKVDCDAQTETYVDGNPTYTTVGTIRGEFKAPILGVGRTMTRIAAKDASFPSFTPWINGDTATIGLQITESQGVGTGVLLWFYNEKLNYKDFKSFKTQAQAELGEPIMDFDVEAGEGEYQNMCYSYFYKDGKFIMVSYCPWREENEDEVIRYTVMDFDCLRATHTARIQVHVLEGMTVPLDKIMEEGHMHMK